jgi:regulatory protein
MPVITDIRTERVKRRRERAVYLDGALSLTVTEETFLRFGLSVGQSLDPERVRDIETADGTARAREQALRFLEHRPRSRREVEQRLGRDGWPASIVVRVVDRLETAGLIDDERFARLWVEERMRLRPSGPRLLRTALFRKGIAPFIVDTVLQEYGRPEDETARAHALLERRRSRYAPLERHVAYRRMADFLARRGFDSDVIHSVVHRMLEELQA